jgi:preprotein translocase subunit SecG
VPGEAAAPQHEVHGLAIPHVRILGAGADPHGARAGGVGGAGHGMLRTMAMLRMVFMGGSLVLLYTQDPEIRNLALGISAERHNEINAMQTWLQRQEKGDGK